MQDKALQSEKMQDNPAKSRTVGNSAIALLDWTIKQKRQNRNMGNVCVFALNFQ